jgi:hypothetical protein
VTTRQKVIAFDEDPIDQHGQLARGGGPAGAGQVGLAHTHGRIPHGLTQDAHGLKTLLWELEIL